MLKTLILSSTALAAASEATTPTTLTISPALQVGFFTVGDDVGALNPHAYRPNEFVTNDFVFEGLVAWDPTSDGADGVAGTSDDFVQPPRGESQRTGFL